MGYEADHCLIKAAHVKTTTSKTPDHPALIALWSGVTLGPRTLRWQVRNFVMDIKHKVDRSGAAAVRLILIQTFF